MTPSIPAQTSSGWTSNAIVVINTAGAWAFLGAVLWRHPESLMSATAAMSAIILTVFAIERGVKHLDLRAGADGVRAEVFEDAPAAADAPAPSVVEKEAAP